MKRVKCQRCKRDGSASVHQECYANTGCPKPPVKWHEFVPPSSPIPMCPLVPHIPLASVGIIGAYVVVPFETGSPFRVSLLRVAYLDRDATAKKAAKTLGGGSFVLVCAGVDNSSPIGESSVLLPGERSKSVGDSIAREKQRRVDELKAVSDKQAFSTQLHSDEEELVRLLAEIHHFVTHTRFSVASVTEDHGVAFQKALTGSERGIELLVGRLRARPGPESWWTSAAWVVGGGIAAIAYWALANAGVLKPTAAGVGVGKTP